MQPADLRQARVTLGQREGKKQISQTELAQRLRMGKNGYQSVGRWETDGNTIPGPVQVAVQCLLEHGEFVTIPRMK